MLSAKIMRFILAASLALLTSCSSAPPAPNQPPASAFRWIIAPDCRAYTAQQMRWNKVNGIAVAGLTNRRAAEAALACGGNK